MKKRVKTIRVASLFALFAISSTSAQWVQTHGPEGGYIGSLISAGNILYASSGGGIFLSTDNGAHWALEDYTSPGYVTYLHADDTRLFAGTRSGGLFVSMENGSGWVPIDNGLPFTPVNELLVRDDTILTVLDGSNIFRSTDRGLHWMEADSGVAHPGHSQYILGLAACGKHLFAGTWFGVYHSTNWGKNWTLTNQGLSDTAVCVLVFKDTLLFAGTEHHGVFVSSDFGSSWLPTASLSPSHISVWSIAFSGDSIYAGTNGRGVFLSVDNGAEWSAVNNGLLTLSSRTIGRLLLTSAGLLAGTTQGLFRSTDGGGLWFASNIGLSNSTVYAFHESPFGIYAGTKAMGVYRSSDHGGFWQPMSNGIMENTVNADIFAFIQQGRYLFAGTSNDAFRSSDQGATWSRTNLTTGNVMAFAVRDSALFASWGGVARSTDSGATWKQVINGLADGIDALLAHGSTLIAGSSWAGVYRSTDGGDNWNLASGTFRLEIQSLLAVDSTYYAGTYGKGLYRSTDDGLTWFPTRGSPLNPDIWALASARRTLFAGTSHGIHASTDEGASWYDVTSPGLDCPVYSLMAVGQDLYAGTSARGVWRRPLVEIATSAELTASNLHHELVLHQNYPNPFNPSTTISYSLTRASPVELTVFNCLGQHVVTLLDQRQEPGSHVLTWDASQLPSGAYFLILKASGTSLARRALLTR